MARKSKTALARSRRSARMAGLKAKYQASEAVLRRKLTAARKQAKAQNSPGATIACAGVITAGGAAAGAVNAYMPDVLDGWLPAAAGAGLVAAAAFLIPGGQPGKTSVSDLVAGIGSGMLAVAASQAVENALAGDDDIEIDEVVNG